ncbi:MAG: TonB-dependent receptor [Bacteroidota bacterium]
MKRLFFLLVVCLFSYSAWAQSTVSGTVSDADGNGIEGASVNVKGTTVGMFTNESGSYSLRVPEGGEILVFSFVGKQNQEVAIDGRSTVNVTMTDADVTLDEVIVTGYGSQKRRDLTSSIAKVGSDEIKNVAVSSFEGALQGRVAGVNITANSGTLGAGVNVRVRGIASINASNQPLYVIDGVPLDGIQGTALGGPGTNPLININPTEIASVEILKDAAATAIYGARASNGVVLITTKSGQGGRSRVEINYYGGFSDATAVYDILDGEQYAQLWNQAGEAWAAARGFQRSDWYTQGFQDTVIGNELLTEGQQPYSDWIDLVTQRGFLQEVSASASGGDANTSYFISGTYRDEDGYVVSTNLKRYSFRANINQRVNDRLTVGMTLNPSRTENNRQNEDNNVASPFTYGALYFPHVNARDDNGELSFERPENGRGQFAGTPLGNIEGQDIKLVTTQLLVNTFADVKLSKDLTFRSELGAASIQVTQTGKQASYTTDGFPIGAANAISNANLNINWANFFTYNRTFGLHGLQATLGSAFQRVDVVNLNVSGNTFADDRLKTLNSAAEITAGGGSGTSYAFQNNFLRVNYSFNNRYLLSFIGSYNGSSRFGAENRYGFFPAVSAGWTISEESFLQGNNAISFLKIRGSLGQTGNAEIGNFASRGLVAFGRDYAGLPGYELSSVENPNLRWETTTQLDLALEFELFNRINGTIGYYNKNTTDLLLNVPQPLSTGIATSASQTASPNPVALQNVGSVRNAGFEIELAADIVKTNDFSWNLSVNIATIDNEVTSLADNDGDGEPDDILVGRQIYRVGEELGAFYLVEYAGVDEANGDALFYELDAEGNQGEATSAYSTANRIIAGSPFPDYFGGFVNTFTYKGLELTAFFQYSVGNEIYRNEGRFIMNNMSSVWNQDVRMLNAWTPENTVTDVPEARLFTTNGSQHSTRYLEDASYLRLKTATLAYNFAPNVLGPVDLRVFVMGQNLLTFTNFTGLDPEASGQAVGTARSGDIFFSRPQSRTITAGFNLGF